MGPTPSEKGNKELIALWELNLKIRHPVGLHEWNVRSYLFVGVLVVHLDPVFCKKQERRTKPVAINFSCYLPIGPCLPPPRRGNSVNGSSLHPNIFHLGFVVEGGGGRLGNYKDGLWTRTIRARIALSAKLWLLNSKIVNRVPFLSISLKSFLVV